MFSFPADGFFLMNEAFSFQRFFPHLREIEALPNYQPLKHQLDASMNIHSKLDEMFPRQKLLLSSCYQPFLAFKKSGNDGGCL